MASSSDSNRGSLAPWLIAGPLTLAFLASGGAKLFGEMAVEGAAHFGYSVVFMRFIGACEVAGAIGLLIPILGSWAATGLMLVMDGAVYSHLAAGDPIPRAVPGMILFVLLALVLWLRRDRAWLISGGSRRSDAGEAA